MKFTHIAGIAAVSAALLLTQVAPASAGTFSSHSPASAGTFSSHSKVTPLSTCYGSSCTGLWPDGTSCAGDAQTVRSTTLSGRLIELRYSPSCRAAWGRISNGAIGDGVQVINSNGAYDYQQIQSGSDVHTRMVNDAGISAYACGYVGTSSKCTTSF
ncbi:MAG: DUF2690 domain-containing protein [Jatrophihabitantaceae bacterium]